MKWRISEVQYDEHNLMVAIVCNAHHLRGIWSQNTAPSVGDETYVEIDIGEPLEQIKFSESRVASHSSQAAESLNTIDALIEDIDEEDLVHFLRLSEDCLIMIASNAIKLEKGSFYQMEVPVRILKIFPC